MIAHNHGDIAMCLRDRADYTYDTFRGRKLPEGTTLPVCDDWDDGTRRLAEAINQALSRGPVYALLDVDTPLAAVLAGGVRQAQGPRPVRARRQMNLWAQVLG